MKGAFEVEGVVPDSNTGVFEIDRALMAPIANLLQKAQQTGDNNIHVAIRSLGGHMRNVAKVLYGEVAAAEFGFAVLDAAEEVTTEEPARTGTGG